MARHVEAMVGFQDAGAEVFDYGNSLRAEAQLGGYERAFDYPGLRARLHPAAVLRGPRAVPLGRAVRRPGRHRRHRPAVLDLFPENESLARWMKMAAEKVQFQGLPARICWLGQGERHLAGLRFNDLVASGEVSAPIVIGRDHLDSGSVASPYRETEAMLDGSRRDRRLAAAERDGQRRLAARPGSRSTTAAASASAARSTPAR